MIGRILGAAFDLADAAIDTTARTVDAVLDPLGIFEEDDSVADRVRKINRSLRSNRLTARQRRSLIAQRNRLSSRL